MEFEGQIIKVLPKRSGTSERTGNPWETQGFVFEYKEHDTDPWHDRVYLETFDTNIMAQIGRYLKKGQDGKAVIENGECVLLAELKCKCGFSHSVRSFDRNDGTRATVNEIRLYKFEVLAGVAEQPQQQPQAPQPFAPQPQVPFPTEGAPDDLPF